MKKKDRTQKIEKKEETLLSFFLLDPL